MSDAVLREVQLFGHLAEGIGDTIRLAFDSPARALRLLEVNFPGFLRRFKEGHYFVTVVRADGRKRNLNAEQLTSGFTGDLIIMPAAKGAASSGQRKGMLGAILGAVLIGAAFFFSGGTLATALPGLLGAGGATFGSISQLGIGLLISGVATMLTPTPNTNYSDVDERRSFMFNGATNLSEQGGVIPCIFGTMMVGTTTVSASLDNELLNNASVAQAGLNSRHVIRASGEVVRLFYGDIASVEAGATLTKIDGVAVSGAGTRTLTAKGIAVAYDVSGAGAGLIPGFTLAGDAGYTTASMVGFQRPVMQISMISGVNPATVNLLRTVSFEFTHNSQTYTGTINLDVGFPNTAQALFTPLASTATGGAFNNTDASGA